MGITPERALELADEYAGLVKERRRLSKRYADLAEPVIALSIEVEAADLEEKAAIFRHYAEILPKWQAVLDAEPVAYGYRYLVEYRLTTDKRMAEMADRQGYQADRLIIKPAP